MNRRLLLAALLGLTAAPLAAQEQGPPILPAAKLPVKVALVTSLGRIVLALDQDRAPLTTANFLRYVDGKRLDGTSFYRASKVGENYGLIQGGLQNDPKRLLPPVAHEPTTQTGLSHIDGAIAMARTTPGSATADFFITLGAIPSMDADPKAPGDNLGFAVFGRVIEGMDIARVILNAPTSPTLGEGAMKGQMLAAPVRIVTARREP